MICTSGERALERASERALERAGERALERAGWCMNIFYVLLTCFSHAASMVPRVCKHHQVHVVPVVTANIGSDAKPHNKADAISTP